MRRFLFSFWASHWVHFFSCPLRQLFFICSIETRVLLLSWEILDCKKANITPNLQERLEGGSWQHRLASLSLIPKKMMEQTVLKSITKIIKSKMMIENSQHGFTKVKSCLTHMIAFRDEWWPQWTCRQQLMLFVLTWERLLSHWQTQWILYVDREMGSKLSELLG